MRHRPVPGLGKEWTYALPSESSSDAILWWNRTTRAGGARQAWPRKGWEPTGTVSWTGIGPSQPSRLKALQYAAERFEARRRKETIAGPDVPLPGLPGWCLRQTLAQKDRRAWQVIAPGGAVAGTVCPGWSRPPLVRGNRRPRPGAPPGHRGHPLGARPGGGHGRRGVEDPRRRRLRRCRRARRDGPGPVRGPRPGRRRQEAEGGARRRGASVGSGPLTASRRSARRPVAAGASSFPGVRF